MPSKLLDSVLLGLRGALALAVQVLHGVCAVGLITDTFSGRSGPTALNVESVKRKFASDEAKFTSCANATWRLGIPACTTPASAVDTFDDQRCVARYLGQRLKITGEYSTASLTRAGQS